MALGNFAERYLLASSGATVYQRGLGKFQIPTLVPARQEDGHTCIFLDENKRCKVHAVAPFGCAFFDAHMSDEEANRISSQGLQAILDDNAQRGPYFHLLTALADQNKVAQSAANCRKAMDQELRRRAGGDFRPESPEALKARYAAALEPLFDNEKIDMQDPNWRIENLRQHLFDYQNGLRLQVIRETNVPERFKPPAKVVVHVSASVENGSYIATKYLRKVQSRAMTPAQATAALVEHAMQQFRDLSGYQGSIYYVGVLSDKGVPHWFIPSE